MAGSNTLAYFSSQSLTEKIKLFAVNTKVFFSDYSVRKARVFAFSYYDRVKHTSLFCLIHTNIEKKMSLIKTNNLSSLMAGQERLERLSLGSYGRVKHPSLFYLIVT
jgi:hypothetical protein